MSNVKNQSLGQAVRFEKHPREYCGFGMQCDSVGIVKNDALQRRINQTFDPLRRDHGNLRKVRAISVGCHHDSHAAGFHHALEAVPLGQGNGADQLGHTRHEVQNQSSKLLSRANGSICLTMDTLTAAQRSLQMARIVGKNTKPELAVRSLVWRLGYRYRLHSPHVPGRPDLVFHGRRKAIFVHGCFWHQHPGCKLARLPKSRQEYWTPKLLGNCARDQRVRAELDAKGWRTLVIWECELRHLDMVAGKIQEFLAIPSV